jgi:crotonobetainyl-CoA:carnitine CoA-transferase CaiB-like acyl-CoA transferase
VESSLLESAISYTVWETGLYLSTGEVSKPNGSRHRLAAPYEALKTADGYMVIGVNNDRLWTRFCDAIEAPELTTDPLFINGRERVNNRDELQRRIELIFATAPTSTWIERLSAYGIPCGPINRIDQALEDPQVTARGLVAEVDGRRFVRAPLGFSKTPVKLTRGVPTVGQDSREVLEAAGLAPDEIDQLAADGIVGLPAEAAS